MPTLSPLRLRKRRHCCISAMVFACALAAKMGVYAATFTPLGYLPGGSRLSDAYGISADGRFVVGAAHSSNGYEAFRWSAQSGMQGLGDFPTGNFSSEARAVSNDGNVVIGCATAGESSLSDGFRWTPTEGMQPLGYLASPGEAFQFSYGLDVSGDGSIAVGESRSLAGNEAFRWTTSHGMNGLGDLPGGYFDSYAFAESADGAVIVGNSKSADPKYSEAFRWTAAMGMVGLGFLTDASTYSEATAVSADGSVIVGIDSAGAWRWREGTGLVALSGLAGSPSSVSADGSVIVGNSFFDNMGQAVPAFIWTADGGTQYLQDFLATRYGLVLDGWKLEQANAISDDGTMIVGEAIDPAGTPVAYLVNLNVPEPPALSLLGMLGIAVAAGRFRHRPSR